MNTYFEKNGSFNSNNRIFEACYYETAKSAGKAQRALELLLSWIRALLKILTVAKVRRIARVFTVAVSLVGFIGVIGAMDHGSIGLGTGLLIGALLLGVEYLCLRGHRHSPKG